MDDNFDSPIKLTEFAPLAPEKKEQGVSQFISKLLKFGKSYVSSEASSSTVEGSNSNDDASQDSLSSWSTVEINSENINTKSDSAPSYQYTVDVSEGRNLPNVLKRISNLLELKSSNLHTYGESELKQYWMPDSVSRECYECTEKFTTFRRRHHCRICGQIFCSQCCSQRIPGKIVGCSGDLRACTYCCKIVLSYLQSPDVGTHLTADLRALQEDLQSKFGNEEQINAPQNVVPHSSKDNSDTSSLRRRISIGYQEEKFALSRSSNTNYISAEERVKILRNSVSLRNLFEELSGTSGILLQTHRYRLRSYSNCFLGSEIVDWLINQHKASTRTQATSLCRALLEAGYLKCLTEQKEPFCDGDFLYRPQLPPFHELSQNEENFDTRNPDEPSWMQQVPHESSTTDSEAEFSSPSADKISYRLPSSSSSYMLDLNLEESTVHLMRPQNVEIDAQNKAESKVPDAPVEVNIIQTSLHREHAPISGWHNASNLRSDNGEQQAYEILTNTYKQHEHNLIHQLLSVHGLSRNWSTIITPIVHEIVDKIQPDRNHDAVDLDIRHHVQFKKIPGDTWNDSKIIEGIVCTKNVAHRGMATKIDNPKILLLNCSLVYQRTEGKLMSLEPVILQEREYLRNVAARIVDLQPSLVLVHRNVSRIAQDILRNKNITLVLNVKLSVLERIAKCTKADLVTAIDAHIGRSKLATCKKFYLHTFSNLKTGMQKTLMFFEGLPYPHLGATILLRGASKQELAKLKNVTKTVLFTSYNWRLEKSLLMDEFAQPPVSKNDEFFNDSKENSPDVTTKSIAEKFVLPKKIFEDDSPEYNIPENMDKKNIVVSEKKMFEDDSAGKNLTDDKKILTKSVEDYSDPLHTYLTDGEIDDKNTSVQEFLVQELPFSNKFRKALDDTILSISPYLPFFIPYLETDTGRKCKLRNFFPTEIYYSKQFLEKVENELKNGKEICKKNITNENLGPPHPFISACITTKISEDNELMGLVANYRACGGRLKHKRMECVEHKIESPQLRRKNMKGVDILDVNNHQRIAVLFCSFSHKSDNAPAFCVNPWVVNMYFYGQDDIPLGCFLERYCFRKTYECPSQTCDTPMLHHIRRFVHNSGCVSLSLNILDNKSKEENIVMWTWCCKCSAVSPIVPMSSDTWSFSFAKYLELRFYTNVYSRRGNEACSHSLHHDHHQYFAYKNIVAIFKYSSVKQWEISLPPPLIETKYNTIQAQQSEIINEVKSIAPRGHEVFSNILEKLAALSTEEDAVNLLKQQLQIEHNVFKGKIEEVQLKLTSPTLENRKLTEFSFDDIQTVIWPLEDLMVQLKQIIADTVENWNGRLIVSRKKDLNIRKSQPTPAPDENDLSEQETNIEASTENQSTAEDTNTILQSKKIRSLDHGDPYVETPAKIINVPIILESFTTSTPITEKKTSVELKESVNNNTPIIKSTDFLLGFKNTGKFGFSLSPYSRDRNSKYKFKSNKTFPPDNYKVHQNLFKVSDDNTPSSSVPKGHYRSQSDGTVITQSEDLLDGKKELPDKKSMKAILTQMLSSIQGITPIQSPFGSQEHYLLPPTSSVSIVVYENELSSLIAYALDTPYYKKCVDELLRKSTSEQIPSPIHKRKALAPTDRANSSDLLVPGSDRHSGLLSFLWANQKVDQQSSAVLSGSDLSENDEPPAKDKVDDAKKSKPPYIEVQFQDLNCNFCCRVYYAERFMWLRRWVIPAGEEAYIRSMCRTVQWNARGGKSGSSFCKTKDDRFILKEMTKHELQQFLDSGNNYFAYMERCITAQLPTLLGKIVGVYQIIFRNATTNVNMRINLLVMENLFYNRTVTHKFDLKGSMRNRLVNPDDQDQGEIVLLDENLLKRTCESPLYIYPHSKEVLTAAIQSDTKFLSSQRVMDYSLLVGLDEDTKELVVGIIDYIRTFTWDKKLETMVKKAVPGAQGRLPTIISPEEYRERFIAAMHRYFLQVPDRWTGLGKGLDFENN